jgi:hypothetical protein
MLRLISAVLHREVGPAVSDAALDLRPAELGFLVPLVACLLALSAWPAAVSHRSFGGDHPRQVVGGQLAQGGRISALVAAARRALQLGPDAAVTVELSPGGSGVVRSGGKTLHFYSLGYSTPTP